MHPLCMFHPREWIIRPTIPMWACLDIVMSRPREWTSLAHQFQDGYVSPINSSMGNVGHPYETFFIQELDPRIFVKMRAWVITDGCFTGYTGICSCVVHWEFSFISYIHVYSLAVCSEPLRRLTCSYCLPVRSFIILAESWTHACLFIYFRWPLLLVLPGGSRHALIKKFTMFKFSNLF